MPPQVTLTPVPAEVPVAPGVAVPLKVGKGGKGKIVSVWVVLPFAPVAVKVVTGSADAVPGIQVGLGIAVAFPVVGNGGKLTVDEVLLDVSGGSDV